MEWGCGRAGQGGFNWAVASALSAVAGFDVHGSQYSTQTRIDSGILMAVKQQTQRPIMSVM